MRDTTKHLGEPRKPMSERKQRWIALLALMAVALLVTLLALSNTDETDPQMNSREYAQCVREYQIAHELFGDGNWSFAEDLAIRNRCGQNPRRR